MKQSQIKSTKISKLDRIPEDKERNNQMVQLELPLIVFLLKKLSDKNHPLSIGEIKTYMKHLTGIEHSDKTLRRKLQNLCALQNDTDEDLITNTLFLTFGGCIVEVSNEGPNITKKQSRYYFRPLLDSGDVSMICGAIASNRYLTEQEKHYLFSREQFLAPLKNDVAEITEEYSVKNEKNETKLIKETRFVFSQMELPEKPSSRLDSPNSGVNLLHHVNQLHDAIEKGYAIQIIYGTYDLDEKNFRKIDFHAKTQTPYILNPYALLWNGGSYYLIATHRGYDNPAHFRVDRILAIKPLPKEDDAREKEPCAPIPESLKPYYHFNEDNKPEFLPEKYTAVYPLMGIYDEANHMNCYLECTAGTLSILIDTFGNNLQILPSPLAHSEKETDIHGNSQQFFAVQIRNVQYDNILQFCLQQHASITALHPPKLVEDVEKGLLAALDRCHRAKTEIDPQRPMRKKL